MAWFAHQVPLALLHHAALAESQDRLPGQGNGTQAFA